MAGHTEEFDDDQAALFHCVASFVKEQLFALCCPDWAIDLSPWMKVPRTLTAPMYNTASVATLPSDPWRRHACFPSASKCMRSLNKQKLMIVVSQPLFPLSLLRLDGKDNVQMGHKQTAQHRYGRGSYHQIGLVRGQFGNVPMDKWLQFLQDCGFDGWEEASWELDLSRCGSDQSAEAYAKERVDLAKKHGLEIFTVAAHLQGQALGDEPSAKTLQLIGGEAVAAYKAWRDKGNKLPRTNPYYVPDDVGRAVHDKATKDLLACVRLAHYLGKLQNRKVPLPGFVGSPAHCWS